MEQKINWDILLLEGNEIYISATDEGLCYVGSPEEDFESMVKRYPAAIFEKNPEALKPYIEELTEYLEGRIIEFSMPVDVKGTPFQKAIWAALKEIPYGQTFTYSDIAEKIGKPAAVRAVGTAIGANPVLITVPCHRVIGKNGALTGYRGGIAMKKHLLELEKTHCRS
ncbi:methylated-DNA--[protein]-cysteine S-methyltransferase [Mesobacillus subterraneus]|uniref:methylated-DNA--[protein]-cysteine S-methyltransferase n=1 Tax=Mesobacillus subterraneus TaxID=285983 RepID=UPI001CFF4D87|nr:methylated-DNA--[protein]-cysteine S-methyltransferase [Mesobacillus subterraneus]WLR54395.1 methylated-DNA--[protein]-cysteine S-methyltransferase [Mesobacillus subterraneus]